MRKMLNESPSYFFKKYDGRTEKDPLLIKRVFFYIGSDGLCFNFRVGGQLEFPIFQRQNNEQRDELGCADERANL